MIVRVSLLYFNDTDYNIIETCLIVECVRFLYVERGLTKSDTTVIRYFCNGRYVSNNEKRSHIRRSILEMSENTLLIL